MEKILLVVDDELSIRQLFTEVFSTMGCRVLTAAAGDQALAILENKNIDVIFLDLKLFGINGIELCRHIRKKRPLPIIYAMTGWSAFFEVAECREAGFDDYFVKPIEVNLLTRAVDDAFEKVQRWHQYFSA